jgi:hypothetical protein
MIIRSEIKDVTTMYGNRKMLVLYSDVLGVIDTSNGKKEICASESFFLNMDSEGRTKWSTKGKLYKFMQKHKVQHPKNLIGKQVIICKRPSIQKDGTTKEFLGFVM